MVQLKHSVINSLMTKLSWLKITLLLLKFQSSHMNSHGYGIIKNSKTSFKLLHLPILNLMLWWMLSLLVNNLSLLLLLPLTSWIPLSQRTFWIWILMQLMLLLCGQVVLILKWKIKVKLVSLTLITSISKLYYILWKPPHLKNCKITVVHYITVMLLVLLKR